MAFILLIVAGIITLTAFVTRAQARSDVTRQVRIRAPAGSKAFDTPSDAGGCITVQWRLSPDEQPEWPIANGQLQMANGDKRFATSDVSIRYLVEGYEISRAEDPAGEFKPIDVVPAGTTEYKDSSTDDAMTYRYRVVALSEFGDSEPAETGVAQSSLQIFNLNRLNLLVISIIIAGTVIFYIRYLKSGKQIFIRKIAGLEAVDEAIGRATEMGRPILFIPGIQDMSDIQTVAAIIILGRIAKSIAEYDTPIEIPTSRALVMATARETVKQAYLAAGRPDAYSDDMIYYLTDEQFGYVAGVNGIMVRKKPAACFYLGAFFAESLILAETGNDIGAIQIAGTAMPAQLPFFIAACDYTLIGEELFAASAYLSGEPKQLGSLKGQDMGKIIAMVCILFGVILATLAAVTGSRALLEALEWFRSFFSVSA